MQKFLSRFAALAALALLVPGCGGSGSTVTGEVVPGAEKIGDGDKIVILLAADGNKNASGDADASGKFSIANVPAGTYKVKVIHYVAGGGSKPASKAGGPTVVPNMPRDYPEEWTVPGGPFKLDLSKLKK